MITILQVATETLTYVDVGPLTFNQQLPSVSSTFDLDCNHVEYAQLNHKLHTADKILQSQSSMDMQSDGMLILCMQCSTQAGRLAPLISLLYLIDCCII